MRGAVYAVPDPHREDLAASRYWRRLCSGRAVVASIHVEAPTAAEPALISGAGPAVRVIVGALGD